MIWLVLVVAILWYISSVLLYILVYNVHTKLILYPCNNGLKLGLNQTNAGLILAKFWHISRDYSLAPGRFEWNFRWVIFVLNLVIDGWCISGKIALSWKSLDLSDDMSTLVQVMAWCLRQQAITWANVDPDLCRYMASLGHNKSSISCQHWTNMLCRHNLTCFVYWLCCYHVPNPIAMNKYESLSQGVLVFYQIHGAPLRGYLGQRPTWHRESIMGACVDRSSPEWVCIPGITSVSKWFLCMVLASHPCTCVLHGQLS